MSYIELADGWKTPAPAENETERLHALYDLDILDTKAEQSFDRITEAVSKILDVPISLVSLVDKDRQWFKSYYGIDAAQTDREQSFCAHAIVRPETLHIPDAATDERFRGNTLVTGAPHIRFYLGVPLVTTDGYAIGTLCAIDTKPRHDITDEQILTLTTFAELVVTQAELRQRNRSIKASNAAKSAFFAGMSHEIRTPLNGVLGAATLLQKSKLNAKQRAYIEVITKSGRLLLETINELLEFAKIENDSIRLHKKSTDIRSAVNDHFSLLQSLADEKEITYKLHIDEDVPEYIFTDATRIKQILSNFIGNAIKFTPPKGRIDVNIKRYGSDQLRIKVIDSGVGIKADDLDTIFKAYEQILERRAKTSDTGTGLGLAITKHIAKLMGGSIGVKSKFGIGSEFWCDLPLIESTEQTAEQEQQYDDEAVITNITANILLVEDVPTNQFIIKSILQDLGCSVELADNGKIAIDKIKNQHYDAVFMDCHMPVMDGYEATAAIRKLEIVQPYIIALTANAFKEDEDKCRACGMDEFLTKPLNIEKISKILQQQQECV
jgi:signal transduction histidine kinase/ActR/RegA family two-component response regulator